MKHLLYLYVSLIKETTKQNVIKTQINKSKVMKAAWAKAKYNVDAVYNFAGMMMPIRTQGKRIFIQQAVKSGRNFYGILMQLLLNDDNNPDSLISSYDLIVDIND